MGEKEETESSDEKSIPISPSLETTKEATKGATHFPRPSSVVDWRSIQLTLVSLLLGLLGGLIAQGLLLLIRFITTLCFYGRFSTEFLSPTVSYLGIFVIFVPVVGGLIVGLMAYYGSKGIRGHGIPEAMEQVLLNQSRVPPRLTFLKPLSAAITIGTGGPFGAEGPIIATGGSLGSLIGQILKTTADERKTLLAAGAAAGMAATFRSPVSAVLLAIELLLFEFRPRSIIPVAIASVSATAVRMAFLGVKPIFAMPVLAEPGGSALASYIIIGGIVGVVSAYVTRAIYAIEDAFARLPIHWKWWPAIGAIAVGVIGYFAPRTLGVGYDVIEDILAGKIIGQALLFLFGLKLVSWSISLGSTTSGGTLAPLFIIGGGLGAILGEVTSSLFPYLGIDPRIAGLVGMAAMFAGASRAMLASAVFAFETTLQPPSLLPLLGGCAAAHLMSSLLMKTSIMTEKIVRRGVRVPAEYFADYLDQVLVRNSASYKVVTLKGSTTLEEVRSWITSDDPDTTHQGFPVLDDEGNLIGVLTRRDLLHPNGSDTKRISELIKRPPVIVYEDNSLREAVDLMAEEGVGRLPVVTRANPHKVVAIISRSDILSAKGKYLRELNETGQSIIRWRNVFR